MSGDIQQLEDLFEQAVQRPAEEWDQFVRRHCAHDEQLADELRRLLASHGGTHDQTFILDRTPGPASDTSDDTARTFEVVGDIIGRYRLKKKIGEGGMGVVYQAEQTEDVRRQVALKILKLGMDTRRIVARFEIERQAMSLFNHPNIARVLDAGSTTTGRPYFVMELVRGSSITHFVRRHQLSLTARLRLLIDVCLAVQHAHQNGIIHRDLKPSNILVERRNDRPSARVIDFGIAKAIDDQHTAATQLTQAAALMGTPIYMSPEQAATDGTQPDTRTDVYSLGVVLYELLTGTTPLSEDYVRRLSPLALFDALQNADHEPPSQRRRRQPDARGGVPLAKLSQELDWIVMKALAADRGQRYATAQEMAADLKRFLKGSPVEAAPLSRWYRLKTLIRRHRAVTAMAAVTVSALLVTAVSCTVLAWQAHQANQQLSGTVASLQATQLQLRREVEQRMYHSANQVALTRFDAEIQQQMLSHDELGASLLALTIESENSQQMTDGDMTVDVGPFPPLDREVLIDLPYRDLLHQPLSRLQKTIDRDYEFLNRVYGEGLESPLEFGDEELEDFDRDQNSMEDMDVDEEDQLEDTTFWNGLRGLFLEEDTEDWENPELEQAWNALEEQVPHWRVEFYRMLVAEYGETFGERSHHLCGALDLLAVSLMDIGEQEEAVELLQQSLQLSQQHDITQEPHARDPQHTEALLQLAQAAD